MNNPDSFWIPSYILTEGTLSTMTKAELLVMICIASNTYKSGWTPHLPTKQIAAETGLGERSAQMSTKSLCDKGVLEKNGRKFRFASANPLTGKQGFVYAISADTVATKVGFTTKSPETRVSQLQTGTSERLELIGFVPGTHSDEQGCHRVLKKYGYHIRGEWFRSGEWSEVFERGEVARGMSLIGEIRAGINRALARGGDAS
jgi:hypothetical protein